MKEIRIVCDSEIKVTNTQTGTVYKNEEEAQADVSNPNTSTTAEHIRRDVKIIVPPINVGSVKIL